MQRFEDAEVLYAHNRTTGVIDLAGYSVECIFKALLLNTTPKARRAEVLLNFRGQRGHDFEWLRAEYLSAASSSMPVDIVEPFARVNREWGTDRRYESGLMEKREAKAFLEAAQRIIDWADGRM